MKFNSDTKSRRRDNVKNNFQSKVAFPIVKERTILREGIIRQNYRAEPVFTLEPTGGTTPEIATNGQDVLSQNLKTTKFKAKCFSKITKSVSDYGTAVAYTAWRENSKTAMKTIVTEFGVTREEVPISNNKNAVNYNLHILDYFQDPNISDPDDSDYIGHIERTNLAKFKGSVNQASEVYIENNVKWVIKQAEKAALEDKYYHSQYDTKNKGESKFSLDRIIMYSTCNIKGNEDNQNFYYIEIVAGKIVRFQLNPHDNDMRPYAVFNFYPRAEYWWGNTDAEFVLPHERYTNLIMSMKADDALRSLQQYIFYRKGSIDTADWNNRRKNGGLIGIKDTTNTNLNQILYQWQPEDRSLQSTDAMMREVKESQQRMTPSPDFTRAAAAGGLRNTTATAANILEEQGDVLEAKILEDFNFGMEKLAENNIIMLQQRLPDAFAIRPKATEEQKRLTKEEILGNFNYNVQTSLNKNKASELMRIQNILTAFMNFKGSGDPAFQQLDIIPIIKKLLKFADVGDADELLPAPAQPQVPGAVPSIPIPGQDQGGAVQGLTQPNPQEGALNAA